MLAWESARRAVRARVGASSPSASGASCRAPSTTVGAASSHAPGSMRISSRRGWRGGGPIGERVGCGTHARTVQSVKAPRNKSRKRHGKEAGKRGGETRRGKEAGKRGGEKRRGKEAGDSPRARRLEPRSRHGRVPPPPWWRARPLPSRPCRLSRRVPSRRLPPEHAQARHGRSRPTSPLRG